VFVVHGGPHLSEGWQGGHEVSSKEKHSMIRLPMWLLVVLALALVVSLAAPVLADEARGKIKSVNADKNEFVVTDSNDKDWTFQMDPDAKVQLNNQDKKLSDLKKGDEIRVTYQKKGEKLVATQIRCERK
jgi:hypothetical protein